MLNCMNSEEKEQFCCHQTRFLGSKWTTNAFAAGLRPRPRWRSLHLQRSPRPQRSYYYWYSITHSLFHSRLKSFHFCKSSLPQPFLFLLRDSLYGFPRLFTVTSEHIFLLVSFFCFLHFFSCRFRAVD